MRSIGIAELKALLSETLARVKAGEEVMVTEHGRPIARLLPLSGGNPAVATQELVRTGLVKPPEKPADEKFWKAFWKMPRVEKVRPKDDDEDDAGGWELREAV
ncbi:MAG TPA: type II toxin-antitoxin system prevent-host-death family antitoxin [Thermoanaerobaculia bacterium]|nr:type II toxin-antitoxin system prevent-host-death family antitoxin [Thermoanaerobaculia bacterium]